MTQQRSDDERLGDILDAIEATERHPAADRDAFNEDEVLRYFLLKHVEIIGEAVFKLSSALREAHPEVPWDKVERTRHVLVHDYWRVDWDILWRILTLYLGPLKGQIEQIVESRKTP